jgi:chemotaxis protein MotB
MVGNNTGKGFESRRALRLASLVLVLPLSACVGMAKYRDLEQERDALAAKRAALAKELRELGDEKQRLAGALDEQKSELSEMQGTYDALVGQLQEELSSGQVKIEQLRDGIRVNLAQEILFPTGSAELDDQGREVLQRVSQELAKVSHRVEVEGHTDDRPIRGALARTYPSNWELAGARAASVVRLFEDGGLDGDRLVAVSFGEQRPVASNKSPEGRENNRRIEVRLLPRERTLPASAAAGH